MAATAVEICNRALNAVGQAAITALDEGTARADLCNRLYTDLRDELLQDHPWNFAIRRDTPAASATEPAFEWDYAFPMHADALRVLSVNEDWQHATWVVEGREILTNEPAPVYVRYVSKDVTEDTFPPLFTGALVLRIAMDLAMPLTESGTRREALAKQYQVAIRMARGADARESGPHRYTVETLIDARR